jgi:hypothetical protein
MSETAVLKRASFDAARSEQLRVPADETLERGNGADAVHVEHSDPEIA